jgi:hypothetical protein
MARRTRQNPDYDAELETIAAGRRLMEDWSENYLERRSVGELVHFPMVSFGGGRPGRSNLSVSIRHGSDGFGGGTDHRDAEWGYSLVDGVDVVQPSAVKGHNINSFRRLHPDGTTYGIGISRLTVFTLRDGKWGFQIISSCGLRPPEHVYDDSDETIRAQIRELMVTMVDAYNARSDARLRDCCNFPLVRLDRLEWSEYAAADDFGVDFSALESRTGWHRSSVRYLDVRIPQSDDKCVATLTVARYGADGQELEPEDSVYLLTRQEGHWGIQASSTRHAIGGLL